MDIAVIGISHKTAEVSTREQVAFSSEEQVAFQNWLCSRYEDSGCFVLSTCNRTEIYIAGGQAVNDLTNIRAELNTFKNTSFFTADDLTYCHRSKRAVAHFFHVVSSLDSLIIGEPQITCQVKDAYEQAHQAGSTDILLNKLHNFAIQVEKKVRTDTYLADGAVSIAFAAVEMARKIFVTLEDKNVVLIGAGETAELAAVHFQSRHVKSISVVNRTLARAETLADKFNGQAYALEQLEAAIADADIIISATASQTPVLLRSHVSALAEERNYRPLFLIDIAIPRDIAADCSDVDGVFLYNLDALQNLVAKNIERRRKEIPKAERIIEHFLKEFEDWYQTRPVTETITQLNHYFEEVRKSEYDRLKKRFPEETWSEVDYLTKSLMQKYLHHHIKTLRNSIHDPQEREKRISLVTEMYGLETNNHGSNNENY